MDGLSLHPLIVKLESIVSLSEAERQAIVALNISGATENMMAGVLPCLNGFGIKRSSSASETVLRR